MSKRITWQNVTAPDFRDAALMQSNAADLFSKAASTIGGTLTGVNERNIRDENLAAIAKGMQVQEVNEWDKMMSQQGIAGLGIGKGRANEALMAFAQNQRGVLEGNRQQDFDYGQDIYQQGRTQLADQRFDKAYAQKEQEALLDQQALTEADAMIREGYSPDAVKRAIINKYPNDPAMMQRVMKQFEGLSEGRFQAPDSTAVGDTARQNLDTAQKILDRDEFEIQEMIQQNPGLDLVTRGMERFKGGAEGLKTLTQSLSDFASTAEGVDGGKVDLALGEVRSEFEKLKKRHPGVPESLIMQAMEDTLTSTGVGWIGNGDLTTDLNAASKELDRVASLGDRRGLFDLGQEIAGRREKRTEATSTLQKAERELRLAISRATPGNANSGQIEAKRAQVQSARENVEKLFADAAERNSGGGETGQPPAGDPASDPNQVDLVQFASGLLPGNGNGGPVSAQEQAQWINDFGQDLVRQTGEGAGNLGRNVTRGMDFMNGVGSSVLGAGISLFNPDSGARMLEQGQRQRQNRPPEAPAPDAAPVAPSPAQRAPAQPGNSAGQAIMAAAAQSPAETIQTIGEEAGLPPADLQQVNAAIQELRSNPQGGPRTREQLGKVMQILGKARQQAEASGNQELLEMIQALEANPGNWLAVR